jgi:ATP-dependent RNA helicase RhlE
LFRSAILEAIKFRFIKIIRIKRRTRIARWWPFSLTRASWVNNKKESMTTRNRVAAPGRAPRSNSARPTELETSLETPPETSAATEVLSEEISDSFADLNLHPELLAALKKLGLTIPTPIQRDSIPVGMKGEDIIGIAQTGTGKTLAFGLPILHRFIQNGKRSRGRALVVLPTRELALQVEESLRKVGGRFGLRTAVLIGGAPVRPQQSELRANPDLIIATPGRLIDHMQSGWIDLRTVETLVLDEADRMLDMGFMPQIKQILREIPEERQTMLFSATMPDDIVQIANNYMHQPVRIEVARPGSTAADISQELFIVSQDRKNELLADVLYEYSGTVLVFARTRSRAARVARFVQRADYSAAEIHSDRSLPQRRAALDGFKSGRYRVLVATDIAARGIDVKDISLVLNYDLPDSADDYVHRIGRTGRAGKSGHAISFAAPDQADMMRQIEKLIESSVPVSEHSPEVFEPVASSGRGRSRRGGGGSRSGAPRPLESRGAARTGEKRSQNHTHENRSSESRFTENHPARGDFAYAPTGASRSDASRPRTPVRSTGRKFSGATRSGNSRRARAAR